MGSVKALHAFLLSAWTSLWDVNAQLAARMFYFHHPIKKLSYKLLRVKKKDSTVLIKRWNAGLVYARRIKSTAEVKLDSTNSQCPFVPNRDAAVLNRCFAGISEVFRCLALDIWGHSSTAPSADSPHTAGLFIRTDCAIPNEEQRCSIFFRATVSIWADTERTAPKSRTTEP